jgi:hypothetical protein
LALNRILKRRSVDAGSATSTISFDPKRGQVIADRDVHHGHEPNKMAACDQDRAALVFAKNLERSGRILSRAAS